MLEADNSPNEMTLAAHQLFQVLVFECPLRRTGQS